MNGDQIKEFGEIITGDLIKCKHKLKKGTQDINNMNKEIVVEQELETNDDKPDSKGIRETLMTI